LEVSLIQKVKNNLRMVHQTVIKSHHLLKKREGIFEILSSLYRDEKYQSFINLSVIQVEGLFYDFCLILNDEIEFDNLGTLI